MARVIALGAVVTCMLTVAAPAQASFPGRPGAIAFDSGGAIETIPARGARHRSEVRSLATGIDPAYSPDGRRIAYVVGARKLMVMRSDGTHAHTVYRAESVREPCFSANGKRIFFSRDTSGEGYADIYSVRASGGPAHRLTHTGTAGSEIDSHDPQAAANGRYLVFQRSNRVWTMRPDGSRQKPLARGVGPSISPDSRRIVFARGENLIVRGAGGRHQTRLKPFRSKRRAGEVFRATAAPAFSPNGRSIVFTVKRALDYGPGLALTKRLAVFSLRTGKTRMLTSAQVHGTHADWQPRP